MLAKWSFLSLSLMVVCAGAEADPCPPAILIAPCKCSVPLLPVVECDDIDSVDTLTEVFQRSGDRDFFSFVLHNSSILYLPAKAISQKRFWQMMIHNATMSALFDVEPDSTNRLLLIAIEDVRFQRGVGWELFRPLKELKLISLNNTEVKHLDKSFADNVNPGLTNLLMIKTRTQKLQPNVFANLTELSNLQIVDSKIRSLSRSMFAKPAKLQTLDFSKNLITSIPDDLFSDMPDLTVLRLEFNNIAVLSADNFGRFYDRFYSFLDGNPVLCDCTFKWFVSKDKIRMSGTCGSPEDKRGRNIQDLVPDDFAYCP